ncbi:hypothetical protein B0H13DRAFT_2281319 [Mycena leptocephala]|nr:hypothetical protein B0H13DRAFT_2281319 [Mycena leptocephala]
MGTHREAKSQVHGTGFQDCEQESDYRISDYGIKNERQTYHEGDGNQLHCVGKAVGDVRKRMHGLDRLRMYRWVLFKFETRLGTLSPALPATQTSDECSGNGTGLRSLRAKRRYSTTIRLWELNCIQRSAHMDVRVLQLRVGVQAAYRRRVGQLYLGRLCATRALSKRVEPVSTALETGNPAPDGIREWRGDAWSTHGGPIAVVCIDVLQQYDVHACCGTLYQKSQRMCWIVNHGPRHGGSHAHGYVLDPTKGWMAGGEGKKR